MASALTAGQDTAREKMDAALKKGGLAPVVNGWMLSFHVFDYKLGYLGSRHDRRPAWKIGDCGAS